MADTHTLIQAPQKARKRCKKRATRRFNRAMNKWAFEIRCGYKFKKKNWSDPGRARMIIRSKAIIRACQKNRVGGRTVWRKENRKGTTVKIVRYQDSMKVRWKGHNQNWRGVLTYAWREGDWKFIDLRGTRSGRIFHNIC